tara:strand:- start:3090 stop:3809 length:720 start_codon:yes stop_codon:yes gene_type:complete
MASVVIKNWDKNNWLSSKNYILSFINFLLKSKKLNANSKILDIGCGRGKIIGVLSSKFKLKSEPIGIDLINHRDKDKRFYFKKIDALSFFSLNKIKFDLIIVKQTIHLLRINEIKTLLNEMKKSLSSTGKILIFTLNPNKNEIPKFSLMSRKLLKSLERDRRILKYIIKLNPKITLKHFKYKVEISKKRYIAMIKQRYISTLLGLTTRQILAGVKEIKSKYKNILKFNDKLVCIIIKNN